MRYGYHGKILHVDLTLANLWVEEPPESFYREWLGGSALALSYILRQSHPQADALDPQNTLVLADSVLTGAPLAGLSRLTAAAKSPLTGCIGDSQCGGFFPTELKFAGFDALVIEGRAEKPVYLWLENGRYELRSAEFLWGRTTGEVQTALRQELGDSRIEVLQCGIAGENGVRFASLITNANRANGRTGMGAVMGSKNLKAVAVKGKLKPSLYDPQEVRRLARWGIDHLKNKEVYMLSQGGTASSIHWASCEGQLPARNWASGTFEDSLALDGSAINRNYLKRRDSCFACMVRCKPVVAIPDAEYPVDPIYGGPEYETIFALGSLCGIGNLEAVIRANQLCNMYGMDTISCGATIAWAMDCYERGLITAEDTGGLELHFGNASTMLALVEAIARRQGFGRLLAEGSARAAELLGRGTAELLVTVKKQEMPAHMPHFKPALGLIYSVNPFGADHQSSEHDPAYHFYPERAKQLGLDHPPAELELNDEMVRFAYVTQCLYSCLDSLNICQFIFGAGWQLYDPDQLVETVHAITGWDVTIAELLKVGEKRINLMRVFNQRTGVGADADQLPKKLFQPLVGGKSDGQALDVDKFEQAKQKYYRLAGWDTENGIPGPEKLEELGIGWATQFSEH